MKNFLLALSLFFIASVVHSSTWTRTFDDSDSSCGTDVIVSKDSCYVVLGYTLYNSKYNVWLLKVNRDGILIWEKKFGGPYDEYGHSIDTTYDGGYIISGITAGGEALLIKTDGSGDTLWTKTFNMTTDDREYCVRQTMDSGYVIEGSASNGNMLLLKTDKNGNILWQKSFNACHVKSGGGVCETPDSNYILVGEFCYSPTYFLLILSTDNKGDTLWSKYLSMGGNYIYGKRIQRTLDNNYIITITANIYNSGYYTYLLKIKSNGDTLWTKMIMEDFGRSAYPTKDSGYIITGGSNLIKTDKTGTVQWTNFFLGSNNYSVKETHDNGYIIAGTIPHYSYPYYSNLYLIRSDPGAVEEAVQSTTDKFFSISPNPASTNTTIKYSLPNKTNISLRIFDPTGRLIKTLYSGEQAAGTHNMSLKSSGLSKGIYFVTLQTGSVTKTQKLTILR